MTAAASLYRKFGAFSLPLAPSTEQALHSLDPAADILRELFAAALVSELTPVWAAAVQGSPLEGTSPIEQTLSVMPDAETLSQMKAGVPLFCLSRSPGGAQFGDLTLETRQLVQRWDVDYILCPLTTGNFMRVQDVLQAVGKVIDLVIENGGHRAYRTQTSDNAIQAVNVLGTGVNCCGFWKCRVVDMQLGPASFSAKGDGPRYYACGLTLETIELSGFLADADGNPEDGESVPLEGADAEFGLTESGDPSILVRA